MSKATESKSTKPTKSPEQVEIDTIAKAETKVQAKYPGKVVEGSVRRATDAKYGRKLMCDIRTRGVDGDFDGNTRTIATSDVFQVHHTVEVAAELKRLKQADKRAAAAADKPATKPTAASAAKALGL